jgi:hypothetical protein
MEKVKSEKVSKIPGIARVIFHVANGIEMHKPQRRVLPQEHDDGYIINEKHLFYTQWTQVNHSNDFSTLAPGSIEEKHHTNIAMARQSVIPTQ